jgi:hypothetical protein
MSKRRNTLAYVMVVGAALAALSGALYACDPDVNQPGATNGTAGGGAPRGGVRDPGVNQPGAAGNVGAPGVGVRDPGINQPGAAGNVGVRDPGINQPGAAGNVGGAVVARRIVATSVIVATLPPDCTNEVIEDTTLYLCDGTYYQESDGQYAVVEVE